jgi:hypothetical protein
VGIDDVRSVGATSAAVFSSLQVGKLFDVLRQLPLRRADRFLGVRHRTGRKARFAARIRNDADQLAEAAVRVRLTMSATVFLLSPSSRPISR